MKINYQIMGKKNRHGNYAPDYEKLIENATCEEEKEYIRCVMADEEKFASHGMDIGFHWNMIYITRQTCGHFEIFQTPQNEHYSVEENLRLAEGHASESRCSKCICGNNWVNLEILKKKNEERTTSGEIIPESLIKEIIK